MQSIPQQEKGCPLQAGSASRSGTQLSTPMLECRLEHVRMGMNSTMVNLVNLLLLISGEGFIHWAPWRQL